MGTLRFGPAGLFTGITTSPARTPATDPSGGSDGDGTPDPTSNDPFSVLTGATVRQILRSGNLRPVELIEIYLDHEADHSSVSRAPDYAYVAASLPVRWKDVVYTPLAWGRGSKSISTDRSSDSIRVSLDDISQVLAAQAQRVLLSGAKVRVVRAFAGSMNITDAYTVIFLGKGKEPEFNEGRMSWEISSYVNLFNTETPKRYMNRSCGYQLGDTACGVDLSDPDNTVTGTGGASSTTKKLVDATNLTQASSDYWDIGWVEVTDGPDVGTRRPVHKFDPATDTVEFRYPFPSTLAGRTYRIVRGCKKTKTHCDAAFDNLKNFGGFAEVPRRPNLPIGGGV